MLWLTLRECRITNWIQRQLTMLLCRRLIAVARLVVSCCLNQTGRQNMTVFGAMLLIYWVLLFRVSPLPTTPLFFLFLHDMLPSVVYMYIKAVLYFRMDCQGDDDGDMCRWATSVSEACENQQTWIQSPAVPRGFYISAKSHISLVMMIVVQWIRSMRMICTFHI